jgi:hypothetical protein
MTVAASGYASRGAIHPAPNVLDQEVRVFLMVSGLLITILVILAIIALVIIVLGRR